MSGPWIVMALRRLRGERTASLALAGLVLVTAFVVAAAPRLLDRVSDAALRAEVAGAGTGAADVELVEERRISASSADPLGLVEALTQELESAIPPDVRSLVDSRYYVVETPFWSVVTETPELSTIALRIQQDVEAHIRYVEGRPPTAATTEVSVTPAGADAPVRAVAVEAALAAPSAAALDVTVGETLLLTPDPYDPLNVSGDSPFGSAADDPLAIEIVGTFEATDAGERYWSGDTTVAQPFIRSVGVDVEFRGAVALLSPDAYPELLTLTAGDAQPLRYRSRYLVVPERLDADRSNELVGELRRMEGLFPGSRTVSPLQGTLLDSGLVGLIERHLGRWTSAETILGVSGIGAAAVASAALALVAVLSAHRRRIAVSLWTARGASPAHVAAGTAAEATVILGPAVIFALLLAVAGISSAATAAAIVGASAVFAVALALLVMIVVRLARRPFVGGARETRAARRPGARRLVLDGVLVAAAAGGAYLLRERGVRGGSSAGDLPGADPLIAAVPVLVGIAAGVVAVRIFPLVTGVIARVAALRRDLVPILGLRRATRESGSAAVLLVLMTSATIAAFSAATLVYVDRAAEHVGWHDTGAAFRLTSTSGAIRGLDATALPGVEAAARTYRSPATARGGVRLELLAVDAAAFVDVTRDTPPGTGLPDELLGDATSPLPAMVSDALGAGPDAIRVGDGFGLAIRGETIEFRAVAASHSFPTLPVGGRFAVVSLEQVEAVLGDPLPVHSLLLRAPDDAGPALRESIADPTVVVESRAERTAAFRRSPVVGAVFTGLTVAMALTAAYAALAVAVALAVTGAARASEAAHLRSLGLGRAGSVGLVIAEHGTTILIGFGAGTAVGLALFVLLQPGLGLASLIGSALDVPTGLEGGQLVILLAAILVIAAFGIGLSAVLQRGATPASAVRKGIE